MKAIIPTGGRGTRMRPITFSANKHFIPVGNKPLIFYPIESVVAAGIKDIAITYNTGQLPSVQNLLGDGSKWSAKFTYVLQPEPKGLANIVEVCEEYLDGSSFVFHLGDNIFSEGIKKELDYFLNHKSNGLLTLIHHPENNRMGVPYYDKKGKLIKLVEKPQNPPHDLGIVGLYFADHCFFEMFKGRDRLKPSVRGEYEIPDAYQWLIDHGYKIEAKTYDGKWLDPGKISDWLETNQYLLDANTQPSINSKTSNTKIEGRVYIGKNCTIEDSVIRGPINIADRVVVKNSFIGPFTSIDSGSEIISCNLQNSVIMTGSKFHNVTKPIDNSIIGPDSSVSGHNGHTHVEFVLSELSQINI